MSKQSRLTAKGQVTIPKDVRDLLGLKPGEPVAFEIENGRVMMRRGADSPVDDSRAYAAFEERLQKARSLVTIIPLDLSTDEYMASIREPVPDPR